MKTTEIRNLGPGIRFSLDLGGGIKKTGIIILVNESRVLVKLDKPDTCEGGFNSYVSWSPGTPVEVRR